MSKSRESGENGFRRYIIAKLVERGWVESFYRTNYDATHAVDRALLRQFLEATQPDALATIERTHGERTLDVIIAEYEKACRAAGSSNIETLRNGVDVFSTHIDFLYGKPASGLNSDLVAKYEANIFSVMEEVRIDPKSSIDLAFFINGIPWAAMELKYTPGGTTWRDAISQWIEDRDHKNRLLEFQVGTVVNFAMDDRECHMTTHLNKEKTVFLPFNRGNGEDVHQGAGNPESDGVDDYPTHYMWDDVLTKESVIELLTKYTFVQREHKDDPISGKRVLNERVIFPRYHQRAAVRAILDDVFTAKSERNYLIQHSAGSGKTNTIAWLAHRLASFHGDDGDQVFHTVIVGTDRKVVDRQLQEAVKSLERKSGLVTVMGKDCTSADLSDALHSGAKIIVTTLQKFMYVDELVGKISDRRFAMIIDEAHNSTAGRNMAAIAQTVGGEDPAGDEDLTDVTDVYERLVRSHGKRPNMSVFAFTATPKARTLRLFGTPDPRKPDVPGAFHTYSMKQAIEEGFILDVLRNYVEYETLYKVSKAVEDDPLLNTSAAKREIARVAELDETNINQRVGIIVEHFRNSVLGKCGLGGREKAMVVTAGREEAVRYRQALQAYVERHGYTDVHALVAFSGTVTVDEEPLEGIGAARGASGWDYSERSMNGMSEGQTAKAFDSDDYNVLLVANKYQVGFDQPKLCAMYVMRKLRGVDAVQTLSRLNRVMPNKTTVVVDFKNTCHDMEEAFSNFYTVTLLSNTVTVSQLKEMEMQVDGYGVISWRAINEYADIARGASVKDLPQREASRARQLVYEAKDSLEHRYHGDVVKQREFRLACSGFTRLYEFLSLASSFGDVEMEKKYRYVRDLLEILKTGGTRGVSIKDKIRLENFRQENRGDKGTKGNDHPSDPFVRLPGVSTHLVEDEEERLSEILAAINARIDGKIDEGVAGTLGLQIKQALLDDEDLQKSARVNSEAEFRLRYMTKAEDVLYRGLEQNTQFFGELLKDEELMKRFMDLFATNVYESLRGKSAAQ